MYQIYAGNIEGIREPPEVENFSDDLPSDPYVDTENNNDGELYVSSLLCTTVLYTIVSICMLYVYSIYVYIIHHIGRKFNREFNLTV